MGSDMLSPHDWAAAHDMFRTPDVIVPQLEEKWRTKKFVESAVDFLLDLSYVNWILHIGVIHRVLTDVDNHVDNVENPLDTGGRAFLYTVSTLHSGLYKACQRTFVSAAPDVKNGGGFLGRPTIERNF